MAAPLPPDMETSTQKHARRKSAMSVGFMGFAFGTAFGLGLGVWLYRSVDGLTVFMVAALGIGLYWLLSRRRKK